MDADEEVITVREGETANSGASYYYSSAHRMSTITAPIPITVQPPPPIPSRPAVVSPITNYRDDSTVASRPPAVAALMMSEYDSHDDSHKASEPATKWKRWLLIAVILIAIAAGVAVPVALLTSSHSHSNAATTPTTESSGASQSTPTTPTLPPANDNQQIGELLFTFSGSSYGVGFNPNVYAFAHSAGTEQTVNYTITNTGTFTLSNVTVTVMLFPALQQYTVGSNFVYSPLPNSYPNNYANIPYQLTIGTIQPQATITIMTNGGWYQPQAPAQYYDVLWAMYYNSSVPMMNITNESAASVTQTTRITGPVTAAPTTQPAGPTAPPTPAPTHRPAPPGTPTGAQIYNPGPLPGPNWNETATSTVDISGAGLNVITQGGDNNFLRQHYYADPARYITPASILATNSLTVQIAPAWSIDTTPLVNSQIQQLIQTYNHPQEFRHQPLIWQNWILMGGDMGTLFAINANNYQQVNINQVATPFNQYLSMQAYGMLCTDQVFEGLTGAGVIDLNTNTYYTVVKTYNPPTSTALTDATFYLLALSLPNLQEQWRMEINHLQYRTATFNAGWQQQRSSLLLLNGVVYINFGSQCDYGSYRGWLVGVQLSTQSVVHLFATALGNSQGGGGLWGASSGPSSDQNGRLFVVTGNSWGGHVSPGEWDDGTGDLSIQSSTPNWSENDNTVLHFDAATLTQQDFFTPFNSNYMDGENTDGANDQDLGASTLAILPAGWGGSQYPNLGVVGGKNSTLFLVDLDNLGGYRMGPGRTDAIVDEFYLFDISATKVSLTNSPGVSVVDGLIYCALPGDQIYAFKLVQNSQGVPKLTLAGQTRLSPAKLIGGGASSPTILTNGQAGTAVVWVAFGQGLWSYSGIPDSTGTLQPLGFCGSYDAQRFAQPAFYNHGVITPSSVGVIRMFQFSG